MQQMHFDIRGIFKSPRIALSFQRIWIQFLGLFVGYFGYLFFTYISLLSAKVDLSTAWKMYGLFPCLFAQPANKISFLLFFIGIIWLIVIYLLTATAISRSTYMMLKSNYFYTWKDCICFSLRKKAAIILSPIAIAFLIGLLMLGGIVIGLLGKIPFLGELGVTVFTLVWFFISLFVIYFIIVSVVALIQAPSIIATTDDDIFEAIFQSFSIVWAQPWRLLVYIFASAVMAIVGFFVFAILSKNAFLLMNGIFSTTVGADYINISSHSMYLLSVWLTHSINWINSVCGDISNLFYFSQEFDPLKLAHGYHFAASYLFSFWMLIIGMIVVSYGVVSFNVGNTLTYLILRFKKDGDNLLEREDKEEIDEEIDGEEIEDNGTKKTKE